MAHRLTEPVTLFGGIGAVMLVSLWVFTLNSGEREIQIADEGATALLYDVANTYEAQIVRALREIDQALRLVRFQLRGMPAEAVLGALTDRELLPPQLLFTTSIADAEGRVLASNSPDALASVADREFFRRARTENSMVVGLPRETEVPSQWQLTFARSVTNASGEFSGVVMLRTYADYFVSGYDQRTLGELGVLGLVGTDGVPRVLRTGQSVSADAAFDTALLAQDGDEHSAPAPRKVDSWDGVRRYLTVRQLFDFPLAILVGFAVEERLAPARERRDLYLWRATLASVVLLVPLALLGVLATKLQRARARAMEERVANARRVEHMAFHDALTGLPNRASFNNLLAQAVQHARRYKSHAALMFLDLDRFKLVNDTLGHDAGDELLRQVSSRLRECLRESDIVARLGGDELVVLLPTVAEKPQAVTVAHKILTAVERPFVLMGTEISISVSIGIALFPEDGEDERTLIKHADTAMYAAKSAGRNTFRFASEA